MHSNRLPLQSRERSARHLDSCSFDKGEKNAQRTNGTRKKEKQIFRSEFQWNCLTSGMSPHSLIRSKPSSVATKDQISIESEHRHKSMANVDWTEIFILRDKNFLAFDNVRTFHVFLCVCVCERAGDKYAFDRRSTDDRCQVENYFSSKKWMCFSAVETKARIIKSYFFGRHKWLLTNFSAYDGKVAVCVKGIKMIFSLFSVVCAARTHKCDRMNGEKNDKK